MQRIQTKLTKDQAVGVVKQQAQLLKETVVLVVLHALGVPLSAAARLAGPVPYQARAQFVAIAIVAKNIVAMESIYEGQPFVKPRGHGLPMHAPFARGHLGGYTCRKWVRKLQICHDDNPAWSFPRPSATQKVLCRLGLWLSCPDYGCLHLALVGRALFAHILQ
ncbi:hypothetical protein KTAU_24430 [Thermogemmatispora aurantia]|uniref:Uncharacterized protein n=1 Tax=Thermogemmatispora aurantia TaxID=2045279 RepID=A0A5J4KCM2_9CHLR|nr:hypothetical protein KTAU_24430 [Thermogemmatispora aurantia]